MEYEEVMKKILELRGIKSMSQIEKGVIILREKMNRLAYNV